MAEVLWPRIRRIQAPSTTSREAGGPSRLTGPPGEGPGVALTIPVRPSVVATGWASICARGALEHSGNIRWRAGATDSHEATRPTGKAGRQREATVLSSRRCADSWSDLFLYTVARREA